MKSSKTWRGFVCLPNPAVVRLFHSDTDVPDVVHSDTDIWNVERSDTNVWDVVSSDTASVNSRSSSRVVPRGRQPIKFASQREFRGPLGHMGPMGAPTPQLRPILQGRLSTLYTYVVCARVRVVLCVRPCFCACAWGRAGVRLCTCICWETARFEISIKIGIRVVD